MTELYKIMIISAFLDSSPSADGDESKNNVLAYSIFSSYCHYSLMFIPKELTLEMPPFLRAE